MMNSSGVFLSDLYHACFDIIFIISSFLFILMIYLISKHSSRIEDYKFYLLNNIVWAYILQALFVIARPRFLFPKLFIYFDGPVKNCGPWVVYAIMYAILITAANMICGILMTLAFRYGQLLPFTVTAFINKRKLFWPCVFVEHLIGYTGIILPAMAITCDEKIINAIIVHNNNDNISSPFTTSYGSYLSIPSLFSVNIAYFESILCMTCALVFAYILVIFLAYIHMKFIVHSTANRVFHFTFQLQKMLVNAYAADFLATLGLIMFPLLFGLYVIQKQLYYSAIICEGMMILALLYPIALCITIISFVKPYRTFVKKTCLRIISKLPQSLQLIFNGCKPEVGLNSEQRCYRKSIPKICYSPNDLVPQDDGYI